MDSVKALARVPLLAFKQPVPLMKPAGPGVERGTCTIYLGWDFHTFSRASDGDMEHLPILVSNLLHSLQGDILMC